MRELSKLSGVGVQIYKAIVHTSSEAVACLSPEEKADVFGLLGVYFASRSELLLETLSDLLEAIDDRRTVKSSDVLKYDLDGKPLEVDP